MKRKEKVIVDISNFIDEHYTLLTVVALFCYFFSSLIAGLLKGGRWDLYQNIAMADRYLDGQGFYYSSTEASSPYFPGVAFLSVFIGKFFYPWRDYILLVIASLVGTMLLYALIKLGEKFSGNKSLSLIVTFILVSIGFGSYKSYMNEFKADSLVLLLGIFIVLVVEKVECKEWKCGIKVFLLLFCLGFLMDITKQQALYVDIALGIYLLFTKRLALKEKTGILGSLILAGIADIVAVFHIPNAEIQTVKNLKDMPFWDIKSIIVQMGIDFKENILYFLLLFLFAYLFVRKKIVIDDLGKKWLFISLAFGAGQIIGGWKTGGNAGNYEAGMISFLPFVVTAADYFYQEYFVEEKKMIIKGVLNYTVCACCFVILVIGGFLLGRVISKIQTDGEISEYLSQKFGDETIMYYSDQYMQIARSTVRPGMDIYTVPSNMREYMHAREEYLRNQIYKYLYVNAEYFKSSDDNSMAYFAEKVDTYGMLTRYYEEVDDPDMPESLKGQLFVAK